MIATDNRPRELTQFTRQVFQANTVVFAEGADEERFVVALAKHFNPSTKILAATTAIGAEGRNREETDTNNYDIQILNAQGRGNLSRLTGLPIVPGFKQVRKLLVLWDAEDSLDTSFADVGRELANAGLPRPTSPWVPSSDENIEVIVGILQVNDENEGCLESIVIEALRNNHDRGSVLKCVDTYVECLGDTQGLNRAHKDKRWVNAWLASQKPASIRLGAAFEKVGLIPLSHILFEPIVTALNLRADQDSNPVDFPDT